MTNNWEKEEWGGWKFVSDMLDNPQNGIYQTSKCYQQLYEFVVAQKAKARREAMEEVIEALPGGYMTHVDCISLKQQLKDKFLKD